MVAQFRDTHAGVWVGGDDPVTVTEDGRVVRPVAVPPAPPSLRLAARTKTVELEGDYAGGRVTVRTNAPFSLFLRMARIDAGDSAAGLAALGEFYELLPKLVMGWNLQGEDGAPLPCNPEGFAQLPGDLVLALLNAVGQATSLDPK